MRKALYILSDLGDPDLIWLNRAGRLAALAQGDALIVAGREVPDLYFIVEGTFDVMLPGGEQVARLTLGDVAGEMSFVEKRLPSTSVIAASAAQVLCVNRAAIEARFEQDAGFAARFYRALAVFLSDRLRVATSGTGEDEAQELDEGMLDTLHVAGDRFTRLLDLLAGRSN